MLKILQQSSKFDSMFPSSGLHGPLVSASRWTHLDAYRETFALSERIFSVVIVVVLQRRPPAQDCGGGVDRAVGDVLTGWSVNLPQK